MDTVDKEAGYSPLRWRVLQASMESNAFLFSVSSTVFLTSPRSDSSLTAKIFSDGARAPFVCD